MQSPPKEMQIHKKENVLGERDKGVYREKNPMKLLGHPFSLKAEEETGGGGVLFLVGNGAVFRSIPGLQATILSQGNQYPPWEMSES